MGVSRDLKLLVVMVVKSTEMDMVVAMVVVMVEALVAAVAVVHRTHWVVVKMLLMGEVGDMVATTLQEQEKVVIIQ